MAHQPALSTIETLINARQNKNFDKAFSCYQKDATIVIKPGQTETGEAAIKQFIEQVSSLPLTFLAHQIIEAGDVALHLSQYSLDMGEQGMIKGRTADVLRKQTDGSWLIAIDNAWSASE